MNMPSFNGLDIEVIDGTARITIERTFNEDQKRDQWSQFIVTALSAQNVTHLEVDLGKCPIISSTVIAGLVHLYDFTNKSLGRKVTLRHCTQHLKSILDMMKLADFFDFVGIFERN